MSKKKTVWLAIAAALFVVGASIFVAVMSANGWDFKKLSTVKYVTNSYQIEQEYTSVSIETEETDILFLPTDGESKVVCYEREKALHTVEVIDGVLTIKGEKESKIAFIDFDSPSITVYMPKGAYLALAVVTSTGDVEIPKEFSFESLHVSVSTGDITSQASVVKETKMSASTGDITVENCQVSALALTVSTGDVRIANTQCAGEISVTVSTGETNIENVSCGRLVTQGNTGDIRMKNVIAAHDFSIKRSTGDVTFDGCDAGELYVETSTGDVKGSLLSAKLFDVTTDTGERDVPLSGQGGICKITTDTGDIHITIQS